MNWKIWIAIPILYGLFCAWYFNWQGPLDEAEITNYMAAFEQSEDSSTTNTEAFRRFLAEDDGKEFVMLNQVELHAGEVEHPVSGERMPASDLISEYFEPFALALMRRGGHPVFQARTVGGNIDSWNAEQNLDFSMTAMMRYRSRRDLLELALSPDFADSHIYKLAAIDRTISYPTQIITSFFFGPAGMVLMLLLLGASLVQIMQLLRHRKHSNPGV